MEQLLLNVPIDLLIAGTVALMVTIISIYEMRIFFKQKKNPPFKDKFDGYL